MAIDREATKNYAHELHGQGYNCAQCVVLSLMDTLGVDADRDAAFRAAEGLGAGMGGMSETCGAISGAVMVAGQLTSDGFGQPSSKARTYKQARQIAAAFREMNGSTVCRELKGVGTEHGMLRSCPGCIDDAIDIALDTLAQE